VICDFGISRFLDALDDSPVMTRVGTPAWTAPEMLLGGTYTNKVDVYSYGIILNEMLSGAMPFKGMKMGDVLTALVKRDERPPIPASGPPHLRKLIRYCWETVPERRPSFARIFHLFANHNAAFAGTRENEINEYAQVLLQWREQRGRKSRRRAKHPKQKGLTASSIRETLLKLDRVAMLKLTSEIGTAQFKML
jgi:serine/threonine protein kinase